MQMSGEVADVVETFRVIAQLPRDSLGAYVISMARSASDVLAVVLLQRECGVTVSFPHHVRAFAKGMRRYARQIASMARSALDVLAVVLLQRECSVTVRFPHHTQTFAKEAKEITKICAPMSSLWRARRRMCWQSCCCSASAASRCTFHQM